MVVLTTLSGIHGNMDAGGWLHGWTQTICLWRRRASNTNRCQVSWNTMLLAVNVLYGTYRYFLGCCRATVVQEIQHRTPSLAAHEKPSRNTLTYYSVQTANYTLLFNRDFKSPEQRKNAESQPREVCCFVCPITSCFPHKFDVPVATILAVHLDMIEPLLIIFLPPCSRSEKVTWAFLTGLAKASRSQSKPREVPQSRAQVSRRRAATSPHKASASNALLETIRH